MRQVSVWLVGLCLLCLSSMAWSAATTVIVTGKVTISSANAAATPLATGQRVEAGATVTTSDNGRTTLRFDDGQVISLSPATTYVVNSYKFDPHQPEKGSFVSTLVRGAMRAVTGIIGEANKDGVAFKAQNATMGIRGTDFMIHQESQLFISVLQGAIAATNQAGEVVFSDKEQPVGMVASRLSLPKAARVDDFPAAVQANFRQLSALSLSGPDSGKPPNPRDPSCGDRR